MSSGLSGVESQKTAKAKHKNKSQPHNIRNLAAALPNESWFYLSKNRNEFFFTKCNIYVPKKIKIQDTWLKKKDYPS